MALERFAEEKALFAEVDELLQLAVVSRVGRVQLPGDVRRARTGFQGARPVCRRRRRLGRELDTAWPEEEQGQLALGRPGSELVPDQALEGVSGGQPRPPAVAPRVAGRERCQFLPVAFRLGEVLL